MITNRTVAKPTFSSSSFVPQSPGEKVATPTATPLHLKDGFEAAPATKAQAGDPELRRLQQNLARATDGASVAKESVAKESVAEAYQALGAYVFGVPASKINVITDWDKSRAGQINVLIPNRWNQAGRVSGWTVPEGKLAGISFQGGRELKLAVVLNAMLLKGNPVRAQKVLFHEQLHVAHATQTATAYAAFERSHRAGESFATWVDRQKFTPADKALLKSEVEGKDTSNTEAIAHTEAFIAFFQKVPHGATRTERLANEGAELLALVAQSPHAAVATQERANLKKFYDSLGPADQRALRDTLRDLPSNWLTSAEPIARLLKK